MKKSLLLTGSSSGIGRATALHFAERGWTVLATMRSPEKAGDWAARPGIELLRLDVTDPASIREAVGEAVARHGGIDALVNNAGYAVVGPFEATTPEAVARQFATNVFGLMDLTRAVLPGMRERRTGVVVNIASMGGRITFPLYSVYHATKWAVEGFSESLGFELEPFGVRVKIVEPGPIKTDFYERSMDVVSRPDLTAYDGFVARAMPNMQKAGETAPGPQAVAKVVWRAVTDGSARIRYSANSALILSLRRLLPDRLFMAMVKAIVLR
jgi:NAD(P)-dependent dehydrogenase (short-subunit alcohol dehydrogenase family)